MNHWNSNQQDESSQQSFKSIIRLILLSLYIGIQFSLKGQFLFDPRIPGYQQMYSIAVSMLFLHFVVLELLEYGLWDYTYKQMLIPRLLFVLRLLPISAAMYVLSENPIIIRIIMSLIPLLVFYAYFCFSHPVSLIITFCIAVIQVLHLTFSPLRAFTVHQTALIDISNEIVTIALFYGFAYFWEADRKKERENLQLLAENAEIEKQLRSYAERIAYTTALEERTRMARDIHDSVGHALTIIQIQLQKAQSFIERDPKASAEAVSAARQTASTAMDDVRTSLKSFTSADQMENLISLIEEMAQQLRSNGIRTLFTHTGNPERYNYAVLLALYRVVQEGVTNILKHAESQVVSIELKFGPQTGTLRIKDNGRGFAVEHLDENAAAFGITGIRQRLELIRGSLDIQTELGKGTVLTVTVPRDPVQIIGGEDEQNPGTDS